MPRRVPPKRHPVRRHARGAHVERRPGHRAGGGTHGDHGTAGDSQAEGLEPGSLGRRQRDREGKVFPAARIVRHPLGGEAQVEQG
jgi:hypothetical protein